VKNLHYEIVLDRSGSMQRIKADTEGGLAAFLETQRVLVDMDVTASLHQFDEWYETVYVDKHVSEVPEFTLVPRGLTALHDAIGRTVSGLEARLKDSQPELHPDTVVVVIVTDGQENSSREFTGADVKELITRKRADGWEFLFMGADQDAVTAGRDLGVMGSNSISYDTRRAGSTQVAWASAVNSTVRGASGLGYGFTEEEREATRSGVQQ